MATPTDYNPPCPFCLISAAHPPFSPLNPPPFTPPPFPPAPFAPPASFVALSTPTVIAFLDILPLSRGHLLLCPRNHHTKLTAVSSSEAAELGLHLRILSAALARATGVHDWNVIQNNGAAAAQVVMHVHFHIIPRPEIRASGRASESFTMFGKGTREELDEDDACELVGEIRRCVAEVMREELLEQQQQGHKQEERDRKANESKL